MKPYLDNDIFAAARVLGFFQDGGGKFIRLVVITLGSLALGVLALWPVLSLADPIVGVALILAAVATMFILLERYAHGVVNGNTTYTEEAAILLSDQVEFSAFLAKLLHIPRVQYLLVKLMLPAETLNKGLTLTRNQLILAAKSLAKGPVDIGDLLLAVLSQSPLALQSLEAQRLTKNDLVGLIEWERERQASRQAKPDQLTLTGGFAKDWAAGYTVLLDRYSADLTELFSKKSSLHIVGHQRVIEEIARSLAKSSKSNVILVGDPGVGKKTAVLGFAQQVYQGKTLPELSWKHIKMLDLGQLIAGADPETIEARFIRVLNEAAHSGNVILFIDGIETILGGPATSNEQQETRVSGIADASAVLAKYLQSDAIQIIATTTYDAYHKRIERNPSLVSQFEKVEVDEPTVPETELITLDGSVKIENEYKIIVSYAGIKEIVKLAERYLHDAPFPEKALDLLEEVAVYVSRQSHETMLLTQHAQEIVHRKTDIPVEEAGGEERNVLMGLENKLHQRVVNQKEAIAAVSNALRRARAGLKERNKPIGTFLFLGPTGVGKTETAKAVAEAYFGNENHMIRIDMNEYVERESASRLQEVLSTKAKEDPYTVVLLDEIEKAPREVVNVLLRVLDEGKITDPSGKAVDLTNTIITATSNAGAEEIREAIKGKTNFEQGYNELKASLLDHLQKGGVFTPEFLNRFDAVVLFTPLSLEQIAQVVELMLNRLNRQLMEQGIQVKVDPAVVQKLAQTGYDPVFGARALRRTLQEKVENVIAKKILAGQVQQGQQVVLSAQDI